MKRVCEFLKEAGVYYLATVEGDQPRVRPFGTAHIFEDKLYIQTADIFAYIKNEDGIMNNDSDRSGYYKYTPYAIKLTLYWTGYIIDETKLEEIYSGTSSKPGDIKDYDTVNQYGQNNDIGTIPNPNIHSPYLDIKQARIARLNSVYDINGHHGEMVLFMPQGSDIFMHFSKILRKN